MCNTKHGGGGGGCIQFFWGICGQPISIIIGTIYIYRITVSIRFSRPHQQFTLPENSHGKESTESGKETEKDESEFE